MSAQRVTGAILAGGRSRRMGRDKALLPLHGKPMIAHAAEAIAAACDPCLVAGGSAESYGFLGFPVHADIHPGCGPLGGIHTALAHSYTETVFVLSCDLPLVTGDLIRQLIARHAADSEITVVRSGDTVQPLCGVYSRACLPTLEDALSRREYRVQDFLARCRTVFLTPDDLPDLRPSMLVNVNTPEEFAELERGST